MRRSFIGALLALAVFIPTLTFAQAPAQPPVAAGVDGFGVQSTNGDYRLQLGVLVHADGRFALEDDNGQVVDTFAIRRLRPYLRGRLGRRLEFYVNPDFSGGTLVVQDAYLDTIFSPAFRIRMGKAKTPFGFERLVSAANTVFMERALPTALVPNRDVGVQVLGDLSGGVVSYLAGVMNGVPDGASGDIDTNDGKDVSGRLVLRPFQKAATTHPLRGLGVALSGSTGKSAGAAALPTLRTQTLQQTYFSYAGGATPVVAAGTRARYSPQAWWFYRNVGGWVEYVRTSTDISRGATTADAQNTAWQVAGTWVLTGELPTESSPTVRPRNPYGNGHWGAFQLAARYHVLEIDDEVFSLGLAGTGASRKAEAWSMSLNWFLTGNVRYVVNFERTVFDDGAAGARPAENALAFRTQISF